MGEAKLQMNSDKLRAPGSVLAACLRRGDAYGRTPGFFAAVGVAIAENLHFETQISAVAAPKAATAFFMRTDHPLHRWEGC
jgi:threonine/homoserine/homoserine lactone efflux protein